MAPPSPPGADRPSAGVPFWSVLSWFGGAEAPAAAPPTLRGRQHHYTLQQRVAVGDIADVYLALRDDGDGPFLVKVAGPEGRPFLDREAHALTRLAPAARGLSYQAYFPELVESFTAEGPPRRVNVFRATPGLVTLEQVRRQHPDLDARHAAWIFKRLLTALGFAHRQGLVHGAVLPCHVLVNGATHGARLVGWGHSVDRGQRLRCVPEPFARWYPPEVWKKEEITPATDLFLAACCYLYLAGGDPEHRTVPADLPGPLRSFLRACLLDSPRMRPDDAWALEAEFAALRETLYGPPQFRPLLLH